MMRVIGAFLMSAYALSYSYASECEVSQWLSWEECLGNCNFAMRVRNRDVSRPPFPQNRRDGKMTLEPCPALYQVQQCVLDFCQQSTGAVATGNNETSGETNASRNAAGSQIVDGMSKDPEFRGQNLHKLANDDDDNDAADRSPSNGVVAAFPASSLGNDNTDRNVSSPGNDSLLPSNGNSLSVIRNVDQSESSNALETVESSARLPNPGNFLLFAGLPGRPVEPRVINLDSMPLPGPFPFSDSSSLPPSSSSTITTAAKFFGNFTGGDIFDETPAKATTKSLAQILDDRVTSHPIPPLSVSNSSNGVSETSTQSVVTIESSTTASSSVSFNQPNSTTLTSGSVLGARPGETSVSPSGRSATNRSTVNNNKAILESTGRSAAEPLTRRFSVEPPTTGRSRGADQQPPLGSKLVKGPCGSYNENKRCCKLNHRNKCPDGKPAQMVLRWFRFGNQTECGAYNYGYCGYEVESQDNPIKFEEECYDICYTDDERANMPVFRGLRFRNGFRLLGQPPAATESSRNSIDRKQ